MSGIIPISSTRVSDTFVRERLLAQVKFDQQELFRLQAQVSTGKKFQLPSEDAPAALRSLSLQGLLERKEQVRSNLRISQSFLAMTDSTVTSIAGILADMRGVAVSVTDTVSTPETKQAAAQQVDRAIQQLVDTANQNFRDRYLFAGSRTNVRPYTRVGDAVRYDGNSRELLSYSDVDLLFETNVRGDAIFGGLSQAVQGTADLNPILRDDTRLADLRGGQGISVGSIALSNGTSTSMIDISGAETIGDVARLLENNPPAGSQVTAFVTPTGLQVELDTGNLTIREVGGGTTVRELGILTETGVGTGPVVGDDLDPALTLTTRLADLLGVHSSARITSSSAGSTFTVEATRNGAAYNGYTIDLVAGGTAGLETVTYSPGTQTITVAIEAGVSTADQVIAAVNASAAAADFRALPVAGQNGSGEVDVGTFVTAGGSGIDLDQASGVRITSGDQTYDISLASAETVEDMLNLFNGSAAGVLARINPAGSGIDLVSRLSGEDFAVGENGGATATQLGIRSFTENTRLDDLNHGRGVFTQPGAEFTVQRKDGTLLQIDLDSPTPAETIGDVLNRINNHVANVGATVTARLSRFGNGIELVDDNLAGTASLAVLAVNFAHTAEDLGLVGFQQTTSAPPVPGTFATASLNGAGANDALQFRTRIVGEAGNAYEVEIVDSGLGGGDSVALVGNTLRFSVDIAAGFTAAEAIALLQANGPLDAQFEALLDTSADPGNDGSGNLAVTAPVAFSGGTSETLTARDVNPSEATGVFTALIRLRDALLADDVAGITRAVEVLDQASSTMNFARAELGAREQSLDVLSQRLDDEEVELRDKLSQESEVDLVEAITELTARQAALEAALRTLAQTANLTLLNFL
jgi:flagellin-like hook-associated protein FlgL